MNKREIYFYSNRIIIVVDNCLFPILIDFGPFAYVFRASNKSVKFYAYCWRWLAGSKKGVFLLAVDIWPYEVRILARSNER